MTGRDDGVKQIGERFIRTDFGDCDPIIVADGGMTCSHCAETSDPDAVPTTEIPSATLARCPHCGRWSEVNQ